jgi:hypothetical protein
MQNRIVQSRFKNRESVSLNFLKKHKKKFLWLFLILVIGGGIYFFMKKKGGNLMNNNFFSSANSDVKISFYFSKGVRDNAKKEQSIFAVNDPIQIKIDFENMNDGEVAVISVKKEEKEVQSIEIPLSKEKGSRFATLSTEAKKETGKYRVEVSKKIDEKKKILATGEFEIK